MSWPMDGSSQGSEAGSEVEGSPRCSSVASVLVEATPSKGRQTRTWTLDAGDLETTVADSPLQASQPKLVESFEVVRNSQVSALLVASCAEGCWGLDVQRLSELTEGRPLSTLTAYLVERHGLVEHFGLDPQKLAAFLVEVERGYDDSAPYHNASHAACVTHAVHCVLQHSGVAEVVAPALAEEVTPELVTLSCLIAAAIHDLGHLGLTNDFLVKTAHERALRYNDQHVNESHHAAVAFSLLQRPELNFLHKVPPKLFSKLRALTIKLVMGTDMVDHGQILKTFKERLCVASPAVAISINEAPMACRPDGEEDAILLLQVALKCADLGHLTLEWEEHKRWVKRLEAEFFAQGDREKVLGVEPVSFLMDREKPGPSETQVGFYNFVVLPLFRAFSSALPGTKPLLQGAAANLARWEAIDEQKAAKKM